MLSHHRLMLYKTAQLPHSTCTGQKSSVLIISKVAKVQTRPKAAAYRNGWLPAPLSKGRRNDRTLAQPHQVDNIKLYEITRAF
jgi:hypothetical protein